MRFASRRAISLAWAALACLSAASARAQQASITFSVFAGESQAPLPGARVLVDGNARGVADARGVVRVDGLAPGAHGVRVELLDRVPRGMHLELTAGEEREVMVVMEPISVALRGITASARSRSRDVRIEEFYRRAQNHITGRFVTRAQIEEKNAVVFTDIFRGIPGVRVDPGPSGYTIRSARAVSLGGAAARRDPGGGVPGGDGPAGKPLTGGDCPPVYYVDGFSHGPGSALDGEFSPNDIEGVEIYFGNVPPQRGGSTAMCGVIVIWTRTNAAPARGSH